MKSKNICRQISLLVGLFFLMSSAIISKATDWTSIQAQIYSGPSGYTPEWIELGSGCINIEGHLFRVDYTTRGYFVHSSYISAGGDTQVIPIGEVYFHPQSTYLFEAVESTNVWTGTFIFEGADGQAYISPGYDVIREHQNNRDYGAYGCLILAPSLSNYLYHRWDRYREVSFISDNGYWVCAELSASGSNYGKLYANRNERSAWETFRMFGLGYNQFDRAVGRFNHGDTISFLAYNSKWVCAEADSTDSVVANRDQAGWWEHFTIIKTSGAGAISSGDAVAFQAHRNGKYLCAELGGGPYFGSSSSSVAVRANRDSIGGWETFGIFIP